MKLSEEEQHQAEIFNAWAEKAYLQSTIDPNDDKGLKCEYIDCWSRHYIKQFVLGEKPKSVLEIGCGSGRNLFMLAPSIRCGYGIDIAERQIQNAEARQQQLGVTNISFFTQTDELFETRPKVDVIFTMWVLAGFANDETLYKTLQSYCESLPEAKQFIFFEQVAKKSYTVHESGDFFKKVRTQAEFTSIFQRSKLNVKEFKVLNEKGFGPLYRSIYLTRIYRYYPKWLRISPLLFYLDRYLVKREVAETFTDSVFICERSE